MGKYREKERTFATENVIGRTIITVVLLLFAFYMVFSYFR